MLWADVEFFRDVNENAFLRNSLRLVWAASSWYGFYSPWYGIRVTDLDNQHVKNAMRVSGLCSPWYGLWEWLTYNSTGSCLLIIHRWTPIGRISMILLHRWRLLVTYTVELFVTVFDRLKIMIVNVLDCAALWSRRSIMSIYIISHCYEPSFLSCLSLFLPVLMN